MKILGRASGSQKRRYVYLSWAVRQSFFHVRSKAWLLVGCSAGAKAGACGASASLPLPPTEGAARSPFPFPSSSPTALNRHAGAL